MPEIKIINMVLTEKEKAISLISNAIAAYSLFTEKGSLPEKISLIDFNPSSFAPFSTWREQCEPSVAIAVKSS